MTIVTGTSPKASAKMNRQQRRQAARLAKKGRTASGAGAQAGANATVPDIEIATGLLNCGDVRKASEICERLLTTHPNHSASLDLMGRAAMETARISDAVDFFSRAIAADLRNPRFRLNLGSALAELARFEEAAACFREAISLNPDYALAYGHLGKMLRAQGRIDEGATFLRRAVKLSPQDPGAHYDLGCALEACGKTHEAVQSYLHGLLIKPDFAECRRALAVALAKASFTSVSPAVLRVFEAFLSENDVDRQALVKASVNVLKLDGDFRKLIESPHENREEIIKAHYRDGALGTVMGSRIFRLLLQHTVLTDPDFEISLTALRKVVMLHIASGDKRHFEPQGEKFRFLCALAEQCFNNEYVYSISEEERQELAQLEARIEAGLRKPHRMPDELSVDLVCLAMYKPLHALNGSKDLPRSDDEAWQDPVRPLAKKQLDDCDHETRIARTIQPLTAIQDAVSLAVKKQYEENPYPRWLSVDRQIPSPAAVVLKTLFPHFTPPEFLSRSAQILIAGCGTGRNAIESAARFLDAEVLAVDLSASSLAYGIRMATELGVANIRFQQGDILALSNLDRKFGIIECGGVLHHMEDPIEGWTTLIGCLQPQGLMKIGLYSQRARDWLSTAQEWRDFNEFDAGVDSIRRCRHGLLRLAADDPKATALEWSDFYTMSGCRDLLFHVQEHRFSLPQLEKILEDLGLRFLGFEFEDPALPRAYRARFPEDSEMTDLRLWDELEAQHPNVFSGMYQFWCQKI